MSYQRIDDPQRLHALIDAILLIEADASLSELLRRIVETAARLVGARFGALGVVASNGTTLTRFVTYGVDEATRAAIGHNPHGHGVLGETIRTGTAVRVDELLTHEGSSGFPAQHPVMHSFLGVPVLTGDGHVYGNLYLTDRVDDKPFSEQDQDVVEAFGRAAGLLIDQATLRHELRDLTLSEERERLARDLHDTVIQRLFGVGLALQVTLGDNLSEDSRVRINAALDDLDTTIHEIRTTIFEIDQDDFDAGSLEERLATLAQEMGTRLGIDVDLDVAPTINHLVGKHAGHHSVQALREMLSNVARHSQASQASVRVQVIADHIIITVTDNGVGFGAPVGPGRGLRNLASRARELGGEFRVESEVGRGTLVRWTANRVD